MTSFLPTQAPGPGPTDAPLATYQSYSAFTTSIYDYTTTITRIAYDPQGTQAPSLVVQVQEGVSTSIGYSVVNLPLLYTGPFPAPPLGTLFTTAGEVVATVTQQRPATPTSPSVTEVLPTTNAPSLTSPTQVTASPAVASEQPFAAPQAIPTVSSDANGNVISDGNGSDGGVANGNGDGITSGNGDNTDENGGNMDDGGGSGSGQDGGVQSIQGVNEGEQQPTTSTSGEVGSGNQSGDQVAGQANGQSSAQGSSDGSSPGTGSGQGGNVQGAGSSNDQGSGQNDGTGGAASSGGINPAPSPTQGQVMPAPTAAPTNATTAETGEGSNTASGLVNTGAAGASASEASVSASQAGGAASSASTSASAAGASASSLSASASSASVSASNAAASASSASVAATDAAQSASASLASASAASAQSSASAQSASASLASESAISAQSSASLQSASASSLSASASSASNSLATAAPSSPPDGNPTSAAERGGLSGGQIAGIVLGSVFALLLLLLFCLLCARRRRRKHEKEGSAGGALGSTRKLSDKWPSGFSRGGRRGEYAALGAAGAAAGAEGLYAAGGGRRGSVRSDEWEDDNLSGGDGSGFFVVGGRRLGGQDGHSENNDWPSRSHRNLRSRPGSSAAAGGLAGLGAGLAGAYHTRKPVPRSSQEADDEDTEHMITSDEDGDVTNERRGLMSFGDGRDGREMAEGGEGGWMSPPSLVAGHSNWRASGTDGHTSWDRAEMGAGAGGGAMGAAAMYQDRRGRQDSSTLANDGRLGSDLAPPSTPTSEAAWLANVPPSYSPPRQEQALGQTYGNMPPSRGVDRIPSFTGGFGDGDLGLAQSQQKEQDPFHDDAGVLGGAAVAGVGLGALAAGHRDSGVSTDSGNGNGNEHSNFLSRETNLLGPSESRRSSRGPLPAIPVSPSSPPQNTDDARSSSTYASGNQLNRLPTIRSVGEFGERSTQGSPSLPDFGGTGGSVTGSGTHTGSSGSQSGSGSRSGYGSVYTTQPYAPSPRPLSTPQAFSTPLASPLPDRGAADESIDREDPSEGHAAERAGLLTGFFPGWTRWGNSAGEGEQSQGQSGEQEQLLARDAAVGHQRGQEREGGLAAEVQSQRASVHNNGSTLGHGLTSAAASQKQGSNSPRDAGSTPGSGQSSNKSGESAVKHSAAEARDVDPYDEGEQGQEDDEEALAAGYTASVSNLSHNAGSSADHRSSRRSGQTSYTGMASANLSGSLNESSNSSNVRRQQRNEDSGGSTGAASYNPSHLAAPSTSSTRGGGSGASSSMNSRGAARGGSNSSSSRRHRQESNNESMLESDGQSSRATVGGGEYLPRLSIDRGLESVHEAGEDMGTPAQDYYPSESLGAAVTRRTELEWKQKDEESPPDPGGVPDFPDVPVREPWRPSPRVESLSQRAAARMSQDTSSDRDETTATQAGSEAKPSGRRGLWDKLLQR